MQSIPDDAPKQPGRRTCNGHRKDGSPCNGPAVTGADKCRMHLGKKASAVIAEVKVRAMADTYGLPIEITPEQAILDEVHRTAGHVAWLAQQVRALDRDALIWGVTKVKEGGDDRGTTQEAVPHAYLKLYQAERAHLAKVSADAIRVGIEARQVKLAESQGAAVAQAIRAILAELQLTAAQKALVSKVVPEQLRALQVAALAN